MSFNVPATWSFYGSSADGNSITFVRVGNTVAEPRLMVINRTPPVFNARAGTWSVPTYRVRVIDGVLDADGKPDPTRTLSDCTFRSSVGSNGAARGDENVADLLAVIDQPDFVAAAFTTLQFPTVASA